MDRVFSFFVADRVGQSSRATIAMRCAVGFVFVVSGALKFLYENQGAGRFAKLGLSASTTTLVGTVEIVAGILIALGLFVRLAALPLIADMIVAIALTKWPLLFGGGPEIPGAPPKAGFWAFAYQARLDLTMLVACAYLVAVGAGLWSLDAWLARSRAAALRKTVAA
jgi:uncharacterized membrane protein YphA (DoxX/SURF4 family)